MSKAKFAAAKELIDEKKYGEARAILQTIDHPTAKTWLDKLNAIDPPPAEPDIFTPAKAGKQTKPKKPTSRVYQLTRGCLFIFAFLFFIYILFPKPASSPVIPPTVSESEKAAIASTATAQQIAFNATATVIALTPPTATPTLTLSPTITETPLPTLTSTPTITPTSTATPLAEERATKIINDVLISDLERISIIELGSPKLLAIDFPMEGLFDYNLGVTGNEMLQAACALYKNGFTPDWRYQLSAMIEVTDRSTGKSSRRDGLTVRITSETVAKWDCENTFAMDAKFAVDDYILDPLLDK